MSTAAHQNPLMRLWTADDDARLAREIASAWPDSMTRLTDYDRRLTAATLKTIPIDDAIAVIEEVKLDGHFPYPHKVKPYVDRRRQRIRRDDDRRVEEERDRKTREAVAKLDALRAKRRRMLDALSDDELARLREKVLSRDDIHPFTRNHLERRDPRDSAVWHQYLAPFLPEQST